MRVDVTFMVACMRVYAGIPCQLPPEAHSSNLLYWALCLGRTALAVGLGPLFIIPYTSGSNVL